MFLEKDGIRIELVAPADIARFKGFGYKEVAEPEAGKKKAEKTAGKTAKEGE
jgi:hypothetical protein